MWHAFEATSIEKEVAFEDGFNAKVEVLHLKNELHQAWMQVWHDVLMIRALELAKSNFASMQIWLDKSLAKNEEYQLNSLPTKIG